MIEMRQISTQRDAFSILIQCRFPQVVAKVAGSLQRLHWYGRCTPEQRVAASTLRILPDSAISQPAKILTRGNGQRFPLAEERVLDV